jgi:hypothetical protein
MNLDTSNFIQTFWKKINYMKKTCNISSKKGDLYSMQEICILTLEVKISLCNPINMGGSLF